jgi:hypothetical protein
MLRGSGGQSAVLPGNYTTAAMPSAGINYHALVWVTDRPGGAGFMLSDGSGWVSTDKRVETYSGTTDASGNFSVAYVPAFAITPNVQPVAYPPADSTTRTRVTSTDQNGFTIKTERNATVTILAIDVLSIGTANVPGVPVRVMVVEN